MYKVFSREKIQGGAKHHLQKKWGGGGANAAEGSNAAKRPCRGIWGHPHPENFEKIWRSEVPSEHFSEQILLAL